MCIFNFQRFLFALQAASLFICCMWILDNHSSSLMWSTRSTALVILLRSSIFVIIFVITITCYSNITHRSFPRWIITTNPIVVSPWWLLLRLRLWLWCITTFHQTCEIGWLFVGGCKLRHSTLVIWKFALLFCITPWVYTSIIIFDWLTLLSLRRF